MYAFLSNTYTCSMCDTLSSLSSEPEKCEFVKLLELKEEITEPDFYSSNTMEIYFHQ
jgi:hypothetical protein